LLQTVVQILNGYAQGTRYEIHRTDDGLLAAGSPGVQLTWMDAKVGDWVVTPRIGKPVEVQALWLNALARFGDLVPDGPAWLERGRKSFNERFWNSETGCLYDVVDVDHRDGLCDGNIRPNQLWALGGLPVELLTGAQRQQALEVVEQHLLTPLGLRTLSPSSERYCGRYLGGVKARDGAYHQGTVWPWLLGAFVECWLGVHGDTPETRQQARTRFLAPLERHRKEAGLDHLSEIADGDAPHSPRGCPFQAWSVSEWLRLDRQILQVLAAGQ
jgi:predicted glycogen debranching enzyme